MHIKRSLIAPELANFDFPDTDSSCEARFNTTQAAQALNLLHGQFYQQRSDHMAQRVRAEAGEASHERVRHALRLALQREPHEKTVAEGVELIGHYRERHGLGADEALKQYCLLVLNLNEFVYLD